MHFAHRLRNRKNGYAIVNINHLCNRYNTYGKFKKRFVITYAIYRLVNRFVKTNVNFLMSRTVIHRPLLLPVLSRLLLLFLFFLTP